MYNQRPHPDTLPVGAQPYQSTHWMEQAQQYAPLLRDIVLPSDPRKRVAVLSSRIKTLKPLAAAGIPGAPMALRRAQAELRAAKEKLALAQESEESTRVWRLLGYTGAGLGIVAVLGLGIWSVSKGIKAAKQVR